MLQHDRKQFEPLRIQTNYVMYCPLGIDREEFSQQPHRFNDPFQMRLFGRKTFEIAAFRMQWGINLNSSTALKSSQVKRQQLLALVIPDSQGPGLPARAAAPLYGFGGSTALKVRRVRHLTQNLQRSEYGIRKCKPAIDPPLMYCNVIREPSNSKAPYPDQILEMYELKP